MEKQERLFWSFVENLGTTSSKMFAGELGKIMYLRLSINTEETDWVDSSFYPVDLAS